MPEDVRSMRLSGLELRKAALLALGFKYGSATECNPTWPDKWLIGCWWSPDGLPHADNELAIESDPAVSEPMFLEWCKAKNYSWQMTACDPHDRFTEPHISLWLYNRADDDVDFESEGATPSEARARAIASAGAQNKVNPNPQHLPHTPDESSGGEK